MTKGSGRRREKDLAMNGSRKINKKPPISGTAQCREKGGCTNQAFLARHHGKACPGLIWRSHGMHFLV